MAVPYELERGLTSEVVSSLRDASWGLTLVREFPSSPLPLVWPGVDSNLRTVDPTVWSLQRTARWPPTPAELQTAIARLQPTSRLWSDVARDVWRAYRPRARHDLAASVRAFPVYRDAWTIGDLPALVVFPCHLRPEIQLRRPDTATTTRIEILGPRLEREVLLRPGEPQSLRPGTASCEEYGAVRIRALTPWRPSGERRSLGVAVATLQGPNEADDAAPSKNR